MSTDVERHVACLEERLADERQHAGKGYPEVERRIAAYKAAIRALRQGGEAAIVAHRWRRNGELVASGWIDGDVTTCESEAAEACKEVATWTVEYAYALPTPPAQTEDTP